MLKTIEEITNWLNEQYITDYIIDNDFTVNVDSNVYLRELNIDTLPVQFGIVKGDFICKSNQLISLKGCPLEVYGSFNCTNNELISLEYCPILVTGNFYCDINYLTSLDHLPKEISQGFTCSHNKLTSLKGCPSSVNGNFDCSFNLLTSLKFAPHIVTNNFFCYKNKIKHFNYEDLHIHGNFSCTHTKKQVIDFFKEYYNEESFQIQFPSLMNYLLNLKLNKETTISKVKNKTIKI